MRLQEKEQIKPQNPFKAKKMTGIRRGNGFAKHVKELSK